uniref:BBS1 domain-containing protein n=1 Tax=Heterorhabditis bacteriophora TaxID=37862 RepID=A0A1I7X005_HETBA
MDGSALKLSIRTSLDKKSIKKLRFVVSSGDGVAIAAVYDRNTSLLIGIQFYGVLVGPMLPTNTKIGKPAIA